MSDFKLHVVVPVFNEKDNIGITLDALESSVNIAHDVMIVYDFPEDNTLPAVTEWQAAHPNVEVHLVHNDLGKGVVNAIRKGLGKVRDGAALVMMADLSDDLSVVDAMTARVREGYDVVCGSRYMRGGQQIGGPRLKKLLSRVAGVSLHWVTGIPTHDITNSFKMYSARLLDRVAIESQGGFEIGLEILVKCFAGGGRITEVPTTWRDRTAGESRFQMWKWIPHYLKWYLYAIKYRLGLMRPRPLF